MRMSGSRVGSTAGPRWSVALCGVPREPDGAGSLDQLAVRATDQTIDEHLGVDPGVEENRLGRIHRAHLEEVLDSMSGDRGGVQGLRDRGVDQLPAVQSVGGPPGKPGVGQPDGTAVDEVQALEVQPGGAALGRGELGARSYGSSSATASAMCTETAFSPAARNRSRQGVIRPTSCWTSRGRSATNVPIPCRRST